jgi:hypothetical protein
MIFYILYVVCVILSSICLLSTGGDILLELNLKVTKRQLKCKNSNKKMPIKENNTRDSNVVPHRSTDQARPCLISLRGLEAVCMVVHIIYHCVSLYKRMV